MGNTWSILIFQFVGTSEKLNITGQGQRQRATNFLDHFFLFFIFF